jgi:RND superfamily putative drug exporter
VITAAAAIMVAVFAAFIPSPDVILKVIGVGMAAAILIDATVVRMLLVPSFMHVLGRANWWMPDSVGRWLPQLHIEGHPQDHLPAAGATVAGPHVPTTTPRSPRRSGRPAPKHRLGDA